MLAIAAQNAVTARALGVKKLVQISEQPPQETLKFGIMFASIQVLASIMSFFAYKFIAALPYREHIKPLVFIACISLAYVVVLYAWALLGRGQNNKDTVASISVATFNTAIVGTILITTSQMFSLAQTIGFAFGSSLGYMFAAVLVAEGLRKLKNRSVPQAFKGLPSILLYIGILALAIYGFIGHTVAI